MCPQKKKDLRHKIVSAYYNGKTVKYLYNKYPVKKSALYSWIKDSKNEIKNSKFEMSLENKKMVVELVNNGGTIKEVCLKFNIKQSTLYNWVQKHPQMVIDNKSGERKQKLKNISRLEESIRILKSTSITKDMNTIEKTRLIKSLSNRHATNLLCELFEMQRSTYYANEKMDISKHLERDIMLKGYIKEAYLRNKKRIGALKIKQDLMLQDQQVSLKKIYQLMQELEIKKIIPQKPQFIGRSKKRSAELPNILKQKFNQKDPNLVWVSDITETKINQKPVYLCVIMDLFSRKIIAYQVSRKNNTRLTMTTFNQAMIKRNCKPNMFHSDRGVQYTSLIFRKRLQTLEITQSFSALGYPYDNAAMESFFSSFKRETIKMLLPFKTIQAYIKMIGEYMHYYNDTRFHMSLGLITPNQKEKIYYTLISKSDREKPVLGEPVLD